MEDKIRELQAKCSRFEALIEIQDHKIEKLYRITNNIADKHDELIQVIQDLVRGD